jgi:hypothetical protein
VAFNNAGDSAWSYDGVTWNSGCPLGQLGSYTYFTAGGGRVAAVITNSQKSVISSDQGETWIISNTVPASVSWYGGAYGNGRFVAVSNGATAPSAILTDGSGAWAAGGFLPGWDSRPMGTENIWVGAAFGNGRFVAAANGSTAAASTNNGTTWTLTGDLPVSADWRSITYGGDRFVAVGYGYIDPAYFACSAYLPDGSDTWIQGGALEGDLWMAMAYGNGRFVTVAGGLPSDKSAWSADGGVTWTASTLPANKNWWSVAYGNGRFVTVSVTSDAAAYSINGGQTWNASTLPSSGMWHVVFSD